MTTESTKKVKDKPQSKPIPPGVEDLRGVQFGLFTVVAFYGKHRPRHIDRRRSAMWACRCSCGSYELRRTKAILNRANREDRCQGCRVAFADINKRPVNMQWADHWGAP